MSVINPRIAVLGLATAGAVAALVVVATGGEDTPRKPGRTSRAEAELSKAPPTLPEPEPEKEAASPGVAALKSVDKAAPGAVAPAVPGPGTSAPEAAPARRVVLVNPGATQQAMAELNTSYEAWMKSEENRFAKPESYGLDCRPPVCMLGAKYDSLQDSRFFDRSEAFFKARSDLGHLISFPHRMDERNSRSWFFYNPYEPGTAEHHEFNEAAIENIKEQLKDIPEYYPVPRPGYER